MKKGVIFGIRKLNIFASVKMMNCLWLVLLFTFQFSFAQIDSVFYYVNGQKDYWYIQQDVWAFRFINGEKCKEKLNTNIVEQMNYRNDVKGKLNEIHFKKQTTQVEREQQKSIIRLHPRFECEFPVITKFRSEVNLHGCPLNNGPSRWMTSNNEILVVFNDNNPSAQTVATFKSKYNLNLVHEPNSALPKVGNTSWTYIFGLNPTVCKTRTAISTSAQIYQNESSIINSIEPFTEPSSLPHTADEYYNFLWHIKNTGQCYRNPSTLGTNDADCDIEEAWNLGYGTGTGIKVAVIDKSVFESNHPDISSQYVNGWDWIENDIDVTTTTGTSSLSKPHGQNCAGLIAAKGDNTIGVVGVAPNAQIVPLITYYSGAAVAFQDAFLKNVDIISCSWGFYSYNASIANEINKCRVYGRNGKGIVILVSAGNDNINSSTSASFPAYLDDVIGIMASTSNDNKAGFSNYGSSYEVAAPGVDVISTDLVGTDGYNDISNTCTGGGNLNNNYSYFGGTSAAAPIAAGICAIALSIEPQIPAGLGTTVGNNVGMQYILQNSADKVGGYNYNAVEPGKSLEMGFGRINAYKVALAANSWDPNNKLVTPIGCGPYHFIEPHETLTYTINFQNLGEGPATLVILLDTLDDDLDISTLQQLDSKYPYTFQIINGNIAEWRFDPIYLAPALLSEDNSKGFVQYSIQPKLNSPAGSRIGNRAAIIFDQNEPVVTNETFNTISISPQPIASIAEGNQTICEGQTSTFTAAEGDNYLWNNGATTPTITVNTAGTYKVRVSYNNACASSASATLTVHPNISNFTIKRQCISNSYDFTYTGGIVNPSLLWDFGSSAVPLISTATNPTNIVFSTAGLHEVTLTVTSVQGHCTTTTKTVQTENMSCGNKKILVCHRDPDNPSHPQENLCINQSSLSTHLKHGDCVGPCSQFPTKKSQDIQEEETINQNTQTFNVFTAIPNPANSQTLISFNLSESENVKLTIYNYMGQQIALLYNGMAEAEQIYTMSFESKPLSEGIYLAILQTSANESKMLKIVIMK